MSKPLQNTLTLDDALRINGPVAFNVMLKPAGSLCNLDCQYCYYLDKSEIYGGREPRMAEEMLESVIREYIKANDVDQVSFNWHGCEPLILGLDFYRKAVEFEKKYADGKTILNTLQTNGTLLNREWMEFFRRHNFLIGISIDGPEDIHNHYRRDKGGAPTFSRVINGISLLRSGSVEFNKRNDLPMKCLRCEYLFACNGECPKHRFNRTDTGDTGLSALCSGYYKFYKHVAPYMERMRTLLSEKRAPAELAIELKISRLARVRRSHL